MDIYRKYYKYILIFMTVISFLIFMCYEDPIENLFIFFLVLFLNRLVKLIKNKEEFSIIRSLFAIIFAYVLVFLILYINAYEISDTIEVPSDTNEKTAVLIVYEGESDKYDLEEEVRNIILKKDYTDIFTYPYKLYKRKKLYGKIGKSEYEKKSIKLHNRVKDLLRDEYDSYLSYLYSEQYLEKELLNIIEKGYKKIIIVPIFLNDDQNISNLQDRISKMKLYNYDVEIKYTDTLWSSESIIESYIDLIKINVNNINRVGINLIGIDKNINVGIIDSDSIKQNILFRNKIKEKIVDELGVESSQIKLSWYDNLEPDYMSKNYELLEYGTAEMICIAIDPQLNELDKIDIYNEIKKEIEFPEGVKVKIIDGFIIDNNIINEIINRVEYINIQNWN